MLNLAPPKKKIQNPPLQVDSPNTNFDIKGVEFMQLKIIIKKNRYPFHSGKKHRHEVSPSHRTIWWQQPLQGNKYHVTRSRIIQTNNHDVESFPIALLSSNVPTGMILLEQPSWLYSSCSSCFLIEVFLQKCEISDCLAKLYSPSDYPTELNLWQINFMFFCVMSIYKCKFEPGWKFIHIRDHKSLTSPHEENTFQ